MKFSNVKKVSTWVCLAGGAAGGVLDVIAANMDAKNIVAQAAKVGTDGKPMKQPIYKQLGTYVNYVIPLVETGLVGLDVIDGEYGAMLATQAGSLFGAKMARNFTTYPFGSKNNMSLTYSSTPSPWMKEPARQDKYVNYNRVAPVNSAPAIPVVSSPDSFGGRGSLL